MQSVNNVRDLPFVRTENGVVVNLWSAKESGAHHLDNKVGRGHADQLVDLMSRTQNPTLLGNVVKDMIAGGRYGAVEIGFMTRLASRALGSA